eukprot:ANDGO_08231.mRNA.1 Poly [ADP-ribose] polymerase 1
MSSHPEYKVEYSPSGRAGCKKCKGSIGENTVRIAKYVKSPFFDGMMPLWHHLRCAKISKTFKDLKSVSQISGLDSIKLEDQIRIQKWLDPASAAMDPISDVLGKEEDAADNNNSTGRGDDDDGDDGDEDGNVKTRSKQPLGRTRAQSRALEVVRNEGSSSSTTRSSRKREASADDPLNPRNTSLWSVVDGIPGDTIEAQNKLFFFYHDLLYKNMASTAMRELLALNDQSVQGGELKLADRVADGLCFGALERCSVCMSNEWSYRDGLYRCHGFASEFARCANTTSSPARRMFVVPDDFKKDFNFLKSYVPHTAQRLAFAKPEINDNRTHAPNLESDAAGSSSKRVRTAAPQSEAAEEESVNRVQVIRKGMAAVDAQFPDHQLYHVLQDSKGVWECTLSAVDISVDMNSFYIMQIVTPDRSLKGSRNEYFLWRRWGRTGTNRGGSTSARFCSVEKSHTAFEKLFFEKTGNAWNGGDLSGFNKQPGRFFPLPRAIAETGSEDWMNQNSSVIAGTRTSLPQQVQELLRMLFDVDTIRATMRSLEYDAHKLPLGQLTRSQLSEAKSVLQQIAQALESQTHSRSTLVDLTNRFFSFVPSLNPELIDAPERLHTMGDLIDSLSEVEVLVSILKDAKKDLREDEDPLDYYFRKLGVDIHHVPADSDEYAFVSSYLENSQGETHVKEYRMSLKDVFAIKRPVEYQGFIHSDSEVLLWHGSRLCNFVGILSDGLKIAPSNAIKTGSMFGAGIYFADCSTKSANYSRLDVSDENQGLLLLCNVSLGKAAEFTSAQPHLVTPPDAKDSVKGLGTFSPVQPYGKLSKAKGLKSDLQYNEYIVYDDKRVQMKYLARVEFSRKRR